MKTHMDDCNKIGSSETILSINDEVIYDNPTMYRGERTASDFGKIGHHMQNNEIRLLSYTIHRKEFKME